MSDDTPQPASPTGGADAQPTPTLLPLLILEKILERAEPWGVTALAEALDLPKPRIHRHLGNLRDAGFLSQDATTRAYEPGWRLLLLGTRIEQRADLLTLARPVMTRLRDEIGQTIVLSQLTDRGVTVTEVLPGGSPIDVILSPGTQFGYNSAAQGKVALAFGSDEQLHIWSQLAAENRTPHTVMDTGKLKSELEDIRSRGWASAPEETYIGINAVAAPVFSHTGEVACTLAVIASIHYLPDPPDEIVVSALTTAAESLSRDLGFRH